MTFVDITKAFDTVCREDLWKIVLKFRCPDQFVESVRQFHEGMMTRVLDDGRVLDPCGVTNGMKQSAFLSLYCLVGFYQQC